MECNLEHCPLNAKVERLELVSEDHEIRIRVQEKNDTDIAVIKTDIAYIKATIGPLAEAVQALKDKPGKLWDILITALITGGAMLIITGWIG